ncbi:pilus assembly protein [Pseudonocardiaceae bacterium YIM PH 21723]|nr:pilus assembly protein [Pseudonocardiaceae bacterium YIM PH 21723]
MVRSRDVDQGSVTVEAAISLGALIFVFALALAGLSAFITQLRCMDAAREAARLIARGESGAAAGTAGMIAPGTGYSAIVTGDTVIVTVTGGGGLLPGVRPQGSAYAVLEPGNAE